MLMLFQQIIAENIMVKRIRKEKFPLLTDNMTAQIEATKESTDTLELIMVQIWITNRLESILPKEAR